MPVTLVYSETTVAYTVELALNPNEASTSRIEQWKEWDNKISEAVQKPTETLACGADLERK